MVDARFLKPALGQTPTLPAHLATKSYVDLAIAPLLPPPSATFTDLDAWLATFIATISTGQTYRDPTGTEAANAIDGIERLGIAGADAAALLTPLGFTITTGYDSVTKRPFALAVNEFGTNRSWGAYLLDLSRPIRIAIEVPHPVFDANTDLMGLSHWRSTPGALLMIAGCHRDAAAGLPDPTTNINTLFDQVAIAYAGKNVPQVQWHGFADATAPGLTQVVSAATSQVGSAAARVAAELANVNGFTVGRYWDSSGSGTGLGATTNVVGQDSATRGTTFIHIENNNTVRTSAANRALAVAAVVQAQPEALYLADAPQLAAAVTGQFPATIGTANTVGTSPYAARADHIHRERQATLDRITVLEGKLPLGEMSYTVTSAVNALTAAVDTLVSFQQSNLTTVGLSVNAGTDKNTWTVLTGYAGWWDITVSLRFGFVSTEKFAMVGTPAKLYWDKASSAGNAYNVSVSCKIKLAVGDQFCVFAYSGLANSVVREGTTLISCVKAVQLRMP